MNASICSWFLLALISCQKVGAECSSLSVANWLLGDWEDRRQDRVISESWQRISDRTFEGKGKTYSIARELVVNDEVLRIVSMQDDVFFIAKVRNNEFPVAFKLTSCADRRLIFENPDHDFPNKIIYRREQEDEIKVRVSGDSGEQFTLHYQKKSTDESNNQKKVQN